MLDWMFVFLVLLIGSFIQGVSGFGFGLVAMGFLPMLFSLKDSALLVMTLTLVAASSIVFRMYRYIDYKELMHILTAALIGRVAAFFILSSYGELDVLKEILGIFLISMVVYLFLNKKQREVPLLTKPIFQYILGFIGGTIGGVFLVGGPFFVFYFLTVFKDKLHYTANLQATFIVMSLFSTILHGIHGDFQESFFVYFLIGIVSVFLGTRMGMLLFEKLPSEQVKRFAMILVFIAGINLIMFT